MDERRVTEVFVPASQSGRRDTFGSGYLVTDVLVLTAGHVVDPAAGGACKVRPLGQDKWRQARVIWRAKSCDAALLEVKAFKKQSLQAGRARLGRLATGWRVPCRALGFPLAQARRGSRASIRDTEEITGELAPLTLIKGGQLTVHISGSVPLSDAAGQSSWAGMSGAALFSGPLLVGVVTVDPAHFGTDRLEAVPVTQMAAEPSFRALLTEQAEKELALEKIEDIMSDALKLRLWRLLSRHEPFGGRDAELAKLNAFLAKRESGYVFVTGPSGFGKTALLAHWLSLLETQTDDHWFVAYTFMNRLDGLADEDFTLRNLCQQLASFHGEHGPLPASTTEVHTRYIRLLTTPVIGKRLVVILDGLDEASEWTPGPDLFPHDLPTGVIVVFSARQIAQQDWLKTLELPAARVETLQLTTLGLAEIGGLLKAAGDAVPSWARQQVAFEAMLKVSGGDPFYLRFLVEDLRDGRISSVEELRKQPDGLTDYFDTWWKQVSDSASEKRVKDLLGYLLVSRGLLNRDELTGISGDDDLDGFSFESALKPVRRFIVGDKEAGYALSHPRFQAYLGDTQVKEPDQKPYRKRLLAFCADWKTNKSRYALTYYIRHLAEATQVAAETELQELTKRLADRVVDLELHRAYLKMTNDLPGLQRDLEVALDRVAEAAPTPIEPVVKAALGLEDFRRAWLRPESVFDLAEQGSIDDAERRLALFETDERWLQVARLLIVWLGAQNAPTPAAALKSKLTAELLPGPPLPLLLKRVEFWLGEGPKPALKLPYPPFELPGADEEKAQQIVSRMGGAPDARRHISGVEGIESLADKQDVHGDETPVYVAEGDSPTLVAFAANTPIPGDALLDQYIGIQASNPYAEYRNRSLWGILGAACCHEDYEKTRALVRRLTSAALAQTSVWFREGLLLTVEALRARADQPGALNRFEDRVEEARDAVSELQAIRWKADSWGNHCRRLAALAEAEALILNRRDRAKELLYEARRLPFGFAGYQSSASLTLAESYRICQPNEPAASLAALNATRRAAHNIQEPAFCARRTARANAMIGHWWPPPIKNLADVISRFVADPYAAEFAPVHCVGEKYAKRSDKEKLEVPERMRQAATLTQIARDVYDVPVAALQRVNPKIGPDETLQNKMEVRVPESKFAPILAARLAAEALLHPGTEEDRGVLIRRLVPVATDNPTAMYTILSRLLLAVQPNDQSVLDEIESLAPSDWLAEPAATAATEFGPA
jgi:hypothetical protein